MRSVVDALEALRKEGRLKERSLAQIRALPFGLPSGEITFIILVISQDCRKEPAWGVALPSCTHFSAKQDDGQTIEIEASLLDKAWVDPIGVARLQDGRNLRALNVIPTPLPWELTALQKRIVYWTLKFIKAEDACYGPPMPGLEYETATPGLEYLHYNRLYGLKLEKLEAIAHYIAQQDPDLGASRQTVANALRACGICRLPAPKHHV